MPRQLSPAAARDAVICALPEEQFGYFAWPTLIANGDALWLAASGLRAMHICPWGRTVLLKSTDGGETWSAPAVVNNTALDDRDAGLVALPGARLALTWFTEDTRKIYASEDPNLVAFFDMMRKERGDDLFVRMEHALANVDDADARQTLGSWVRVSADGVQWSTPRRAPVNAPHGFTLLKDGRWLYFGQSWTRGDEKTASAAGCGTDEGIWAAFSDDEGRTWTVAGAVPTGDRQVGNLCEAHAIEVAEGHLLGAVRQNAPFTILFTESHDGGAIWSPLRESGASGAPPHLMRHSSGRLLCSYSHRAAPFGIRAMVSEDDGATWPEEYVVSDRGADWDLGYPSTVELPGGDLLTAYYMHLNGEANASLVCTRWKM